MKRKYWKGHNEIGRAKGRVVQIKRKEIGLDCSDFQVNFNFAKFITRKYGRYKSEVPIEWNSH